jgi:hypothetical protein
MIIVDYSCRLIDFLFEYFEFLGIRQYLELKPQK